MDNDGRICRKTKLASPCLKSNDVVESTLVRIKRPCKKVPAVVSKLPAVAIATQSIETDTNSIREMNPGQSNIMPMNFDIKVELENVDEIKIEKQHEIISWREIVKESTEIYLQSNNICDKILHGQVLNTCKPDVKLFVKTPHEKLLDRAFTGWCDWASLTEELKDPPLFYKCYICDMAWWHLAYFRDHIRTHEPSSLHIVLEMIDDFECNIVAYYSKSANKYIANIEGKCWKCGEKASEHTKLKNCVGCKKRFYTCSKLRQHQWYCEEFKKMHLDLFASAEKIFKCHLCRFYFFKKEDCIEHMILRHSVRSDVPIPGCAVCEKCKDMMSDEDNHVCESKGYVKTCGACKKRVTESSAAVHQIEGNFTCSVCKVKIVKTCSIHLHALSHTMNYGLAYKCLTCNFFIIFDLEQIKNHKMFYHSNRDFDYDLISIPKTIVNRIKSTPDKHDSPVDSQINTFLLPYDPQDMVNDRDDDDVIIIDNVPKVIVIPSDDAPNDDLPCVIANIKSEPLENEIQTSETKETVTLQNDFECKTMVIQIPKDTKDVFRCHSDGNRINDDKVLDIDEIKRELNTVDHIKKFKPRTKQTLLTDVSLNLESDVKIEVIKSVDVVEKEKLITVGLSGTQLNEQKREKGEPVDTFKNLEQMTPKESEVSELIKVEKFEETVDEIDIPWHTVPIKEEADPEMDFKLSNIRSLSNVGENEIDVKQEINKFDLTGQSKYWYSFANNSHLITISPKVTLNTDDDSDDEINRPHRKIEKTAYNRTMEKQPDDPEDFTNEPLPSMSELMEVQDTVAYTFATPLAKPIISASKSKAQKQREYRQRIAASRTPAQAAAARKSKNERQRINRLRQATNLAITSDSLEATTAVASPSVPKTRAQIQREYRQRIAASKTPAQAAAAREARNIRDRNNRLRLAANLAIASGSLEATTVVTSTSAPKTRAQIQREYRQRIAAYKTAQSAAARETRNVREKNNRLHQAPDLAIASGSLEATTADASAFATKTRAEIQREYRQRIAAYKTPAQAAAAREARNVRDRNNRLRQAANLAIASVYCSLEATTTSSSRPEQRLHTVHIDTQRQFTDQQRLTLATEPTLAAETTVQPSTSSDQVDQFKHNLLGTLHGHHQS